jgi:hypothetical protein
MAKNPIVLLGVVLVVGLGVWLFASRMDRSGDLSPLKPPPGESLRRQGVPPPPPVVDPAASLKQLDAMGALAQGDLTLRELLRKALEAKEAPSWRCIVDVPMEDTAAQQVRDEVKEWFSRKMAGLGFTEAAGRPTALVHVRLDPAGDGKYAFHLVVRSAGEPRFDEKFELPSAYKADRLDTALARSFAPPAPSSEKKP